MGYTHKKVQMLLDITRYYSICHVISCPMSLEYTGNTIFLMSLFLCPSSWSAISSLHPTVAFQRALVCCSWLFEDISFHLDITLLASYRQSPTTVIMSSGKLSKPTKDIHQKIKRMIPDLSDQPIENRATLLETEDSGKEQDLRGSGGAYSRNRLLSFKTFTHLRPRSMCVEDCFCSLPWPSSGIISHQRWKWNPTSERGKVYHLTLALRV